MKISISVPEALLDEVDKLAEDAGVTRSEVFADIVRYVLDHEDILDEIYPPEEEAEEEEEEEIEEEEEE